MSNFKDIDADIFYTSDLNYHSSFYGKDSIINIVTFGSLAIALDNDGRFVDCIVADKKYVRER